MGNRSWADAHGHYKEFLPSAAVPQWYVSLLPVQLDGQDNIFLHRQYGYQVVALKHKALPGLGSHFDVTSLFGQNFPGQVEPKSYPSAA